MTSVAEFLRKQDAFGYAVTLNYRGDDMYNTAWGGILTLAQKVFILVVAVMGVIDLFNYKDPNITQYKIYDKRNDNREFNYGELHGAFLFAFETK